MSEFSRAKHKEFGFSRDMEVLPYFLPDGRRAAVARPARPVPTRGPTSSSSAGSSGSRDSTTSYPCSSGSTAPTCSSRETGTTRTRFASLAGGESTHPFSRPRRSGTAPRLTTSTPSRSSFRRSASRRSASSSSKHFARVRRSSLVGSGRFRRSSTGRAPAYCSLRPRAPRRASRASATDADFRARTAAAGRQAFDEHWSERVVVPAYLDLVQRTAGRKRRQRALAGSEHTEVA